MVIITKCRCVNKNGHLCFPSHQIIHSVYHSVQIQVKQEVKIQAKAQVDLQLKVQVKVQHLVGQDLIVGSSLSSHNHHQ